MGMIRLACVGLMLLLLTDCGGADGTGGNPLIDGSHVVRNDLSASPMASLRSHPFQLTGLVDVESLMDWAEVAYPEYFPGHGVTQFEAPYFYRHYPATGNYLGVDGNTIRVLIPSLSSDILTVGSLDDFVCKVLPEACSGQVVFGLAPRPPATTTSPNVFWMRPDTVIYEFLTSNELVYTEVKPYPAELSGGRNMLVYLQPPEGEFAARNLGTVEFNPRQVIEPFLVTDALAKTPAQYRLGLDKNAFLDITWAGRGCNYSYSAFYLHEVTLDASGDLSKLAADFSYGCEGYERPVRGVVRLNSALPSVMQRAYAVAGIDIDVGEGRGIILDGRRSWSPASKITKIKWTQISGPTLDLSQCNSLYCRTYAPVLPSGGETAVLQLDIETQNGLKDSDQMRIHILANSDRKTLFEIWGIGTVTAGGDYSVGPTNGKAAVHTKLGSQSIYADQTLDRLHLGFSGRPAAPFAGVREIGFDVTLMNKKGSALVPGTYVDPLSWLAFEAFEKQPSVSISNIGDAIACDAEIGRAIIGEIDRDAADYTKIRSLSAFGEIRCVTLNVAELDSTYFRVLINHLPTKRPVARIVGNTSVSAGERIELSAAASTGANPIDTVVWRQIFGKTITDAFVSDDGYALNGQVDPGLPSGTRLVFAADVIDQKAEQDTAILVVTVK